MPGEKMKIDISAFNGAITATIPELLPDNFASNAVNAETINGSITPIKQLVANADVTTTALTNSIKRLLFRGNSSLVVQGVNNERWVTSPLAQDDFDRVYWTSSNGVPMTSSYQGFGTTDYELGIAKPQTSITIDSTASSGDVVMATSAIFVEESEWGELSEPCDPVNFDLKSSGSVTLSMPAAPASGHWTNRQIYLADFSGNYLHYLTVPNTQANVTITLPFDTALLVTELDQIVTGALNTKPRVNMQGLVSLPGGVLAGYENNVVCLSKAYLPHAWPANYEITVDGNIKAIQAASSGLVVLTDRNPYLIVGSSPDAMSPVQIDMTEPCYAPLAVVDMGPYVIYPSNDGLIAIAGQDNRNLIDGVIDRDEWRASVKTDAVACAFNGKYWYFSDNGGFVFDVQSKSYAKHDISAIAVYADDINDQIYIVTPGGSLQTYSRSNASPKSFTWTSKVFELNDISPFSSAKVSSNGPVTVKFDYFYRDANQVAQTETTSVTANPHEAFRLPAIRSDSIQITLSGTNSIKRLQIASSMRELAR